MKKTLYFLAAALFLSSSSLADVKIKNTFGSVTVFHNQQWQDAKIGTVLELDDIVKTSELGKAVLVVNDNSRVWVGRNTQMRISNPGTESVFALVAGKIRAKVKLLGGNKFSVTTPVSVASVRGTDFGMDLDESTNNEEAFVLKGEIDYSKKDNSSSVKVKENQIAMLGMDGIFSEPREMTPLELQKIESDWQDFGQLDPGDKTDSEGEDKDKEAKKELDELKAELLEIVENIKTDVDSTREMTNEIKESDLSAGRTLRDVHGNLVRVEQHFLRPDDYTFQILNLTKRDEGYTYRDRNNWGFKVENKPRLDIADVRITMNMRMPEQITDWPGFISGKDDALHPTSMVMSMTNQTDTIEIVGTWGVEGVDRDEKGELLTEDRMVSKPYINGWEVDTTYEPSTDNLGQSYPPDDSEIADLNVWAISPKMRVVKGGVTKYVYMYTEGYGINNDGKILNLKDFTSASDNPFVSFKQIAGENIIFVRNADNGASFLDGGNIDLVLTPDLMIAVATKLAGQIGDLSSSD